ncbi:MAG: hypothetical protein ACYC3O_07200 [Burkholderiales bacterium]
MKAKIDTKTINFEAAPVKRGRGRPKGANTKTSTERMRDLKERRDAVANSILEDIAARSDEEILYALADRLKGQKKGFDFATSIVALSRELMRRYNVN